MIVISPIRATKPIRVWCGGIGCGSGAPLPRARTRSSKGAKLSRTLASATRLPRELSACSVRSKSQAPAVSSRSTPARSSVTRRSVGRSSACSRRSSSVALVTSQLPAARMISAPDSSEATMVAGGAMLSRQQSMVTSGRGVDSSQLREHPVSRNDYGGRQPQERAMDFKQHIRAIPDFPKPGILFYDISTLLAHPQAWHATVEQLATAIRPHRPDLLLGIESRGFLVAAPLAYAIGSGFAMVRKRGKLPGKTVQYSYDLEYGSDTIEVQEDTISPGQRIVVVDDLVATGGTMRAAIDLVQQRGGTVAAAACIIELAFLNGRDRLPVPLTAIVTYDS